MDTKYLTELVMDKFIKNDCYTEVPIDKLTMIISEYLDKYYLDQVKMGIATIQIKQAGGRETNELHYKESYAVAKNKTIKQAYAIGAIDKKDLKDLKEMAKL